jgi:hypothetical protein
VADGGFRRYPTVSADITDARVIPPTASDTDAMSYLIMISPGARHTASAEIAKRPLRRTKVTLVWNANDIAHGTPGTELAVFRGASPDSARPAVESNEQVEIPATARPHLRFAHESSRSW